MKVGSASRNFGAATADATESLLAALGRNANGNSYTGDLDNTQIYNNALSDAAAQAATTIPEPASLALLGLGGLCIMPRRRSRA